MTLNLKGKTALVTGGTRGIGRAIAETLLEAGASVAVCGVREESVRAAQMELSAKFPSDALKVVTATADVSNEEDVRRLFETVDRELGGLDILVNNAGIGRFADLAALAPSDWRALMGTNLDGVYYCIHEALPRFRVRGGGWIVNIASLAGKNPFAGGAAYNASKFGLCGLSEAVMLDHRYENVRVTAVLPGSVSTDFSRGGQADWKIQPEDVAEAVAMILAMPERTLISHVEIRPAKPPKK
ncbi:MAG: SDR family oxidoreductase [Bryobacteraceae bacterium]|nr:SDR family oxidoreductase [Bryobacteraceae bacterium]